VKQAVLHGEFEKEKEIYMKIPVGRKELYSPVAVSLLLCTIHGLKQAATKFWKEQLTATRGISLKRSPIDPYLSMTVYSTHSVYFMK
jgi:hypothetical protein